MLILRVGCWGEGGFCNSLQVIFFHSINFSLILVGFHQFPVTFRQFFINFILSLLISISFPILCQFSINFYWFPLVFYYSFIIICYIHHKCIIIYQGIVQLTVGNYLYLSILQHLKHSARGERPESSPNPRVLHVRRFAKTV